MLNFIFKGGETMEFKSLQEQIREFAYNSPEKVAIEYDGLSISYFEINRKSNHIAKFLLENVIENKKIFLFIDKSHFLIECILGVLKFGGIFIPLDSRLSENRLRMIMDQIQSNWVLSELKYLDKLNEIAKISGNKLNVFIEDLGHKDNNDYPYLNISIIDEYPIGVHVDEVDIFNENCYIYFTSGSTGKPKGILGRHKSLKHFIDWEIEELKVNEDFRVSQIINPTFDPFLRDIFVPLCAGATICIPKDDEIILNPSKLINWIDSEGITFMHMVPTLFKNMVREIENSNCLDSLKYILLAGELVKGKDLEIFYEVFDSRIQLVNLYGPTETTLAKVYYFINKDDVNRVNIPIGKPIKDTEILILDKEKKICNVNEIGEIYISTPYASSGYINQVDLNNQVFLKNPYSKNSNDMMYKTGDIGKILEDGNIECLGRLDNQIKIRGMRVELSEIETHILRSNLVKEAVVIAKEDENGEKFICAFLESSEDIDISKLRELLIKVLPDYMVPAYFTRVPKMPLLPNGKVSRKALSKYVINVETGVSYQAPRNENETKLIKLWQDVLSVARIGIKDNFFHLGGHSLKAANLASKIYKEFSVDISVKEIFKSSTVESMAKLIESSDKGRYEAIPIVEKREYYPASSAQKRVFMLTLIEESGTSYNMPDVMIVDGSLDKDLLEDSIKEIIGRHEALRTSFELMDEGLMQRVHKDVEFKIEYMEIENAGDGKLDIDKEINRIIKDFIRPFDLKKPPLLRIGLVKIAKDKYILLRDMQHIIGDGISEEIFKAELRKLYSGLKLPKPKLQYKDFSEWQNDLFNTEKIESQGNYWIDLFSGEIPVLNMPADYIRPPKPKFEGNTITIDLDKELVEKMSNVAAQNGATIYMLMLSVFNILLSKYTGQEDIVVGSPIAGRNHADLDNVMGVLINTLAMRNYPDNKKTFKEFLKSVKNNCIEAFENQEYQFEDLIDKLNIKRDLSRNPLFDVMFMMQNMDFEDMSMGNIRVKPYSFKSNVSKFDLTLIAMERYGSMKLSFEYSTCIFKEKTIERLAQHYINILKQVVEEANIKLFEINMMSINERKQLFYEFNDTYTEYDGHETIHQTFEKQAERTPDKVALVFEDSKLTYRELNTKANQLARKIREIGVKPDSVVGLMMPRSLEMIIGILGILKAGGAYLPIDPEYPEQRVEYMLQNSKIDILLTEPSLNKVAGNIKAINLLNDSLYIGDGCNLENITDVDNLAYVIYTSGSTGKPKGVMINHKNVKNFIKGMIDIIDFHPNKTILNVTTISFDIFLLETLLPLTKGLTVVIANEEQQIDPDMLSDLIIDNKVDMIQTTPSRMILLLKSRKGMVCLKNIKELVIGGEAFPDHLLVKLRQLKNIKIYNVYGPTEATVWSTVKDLTNHESITIGKPIANTSIHILDKYGSLQPVGVVGELNIGGDGVARGYHNREDITKERFVINPFCEGELMYKTGDLARWLPNGEIEFLGRVDHQVKVRGYRIEIEEIEKHIINYKGIKDCVCIVDEDKHGVKHLVVFYVSDHEIVVSEIRTYLSKFLPDYMIPLIYVHLEKLPTTPNGKIDKKALLSLNIKSPKLKTEYVAAKNEVEKELVKIWSQVLNKDDIGTKDSFFDLGGNSFLLVMMYSNLDKLYPGRMTIADIFANPTISKLAKFINADEDRPSSIELIPIELPQEFLIDNIELEEDIILQYKLESPLIEKLKTYSTEKELYFMDIFLASYVYLLSEITGQDEIVIQVAIDAENFIQLKIDTLDVQDFVSLCKYISTQRESISRDDAYSIDMLDTIELKKQNNLLVPFFLNIQNTSCNLLSNYGLILKVSEGYKDTSLTFQCSASRIKENKAEDLFKWYVNLIKLIIEESI